MIPQHTLAAPVVLSIAEWNAVVGALQFLPGVVAGPIIAAIQAQQQPSPAPSPETA